MPTRHQIQRRKGWRWPPGVLRVDRASRWGNPFIIGVHGSHSDCVRRHADLVERGMVTMTSPGHVKEQRDYLAYVNTAIGLLAERDVACWCPVNAECHGDTLMRRAARFKCEEMR